MQIPLGGTVVCGVDSLAVLGAGVGSAAVG